MVRKHDFGCFFIRLRNTGVVSEAVLAIAIVFAIVKTLNLDHQYRKKYKCQN